MTEVTEAVLFSLGSRSMNDKQKLNQAKLVGEIILEQISEDANLDGLPENTKMDFTLNVYQLKRLQEAVR